MQKKSKRHLLADRLASHIHLFIEDGPTELTIDLDILIGQ